MSNINFVPTDYVQKRDSTRANLIYVFLFGIVMTGIGATFWMIQVRQKAINSEIAKVDAALNEAKDKFKLLEELQNTGNEMMKTAAMTAELFENAPKSTVLACLTNSLPEGVSLLELKLFQKEVSAPVVSTQYKKKAKKKKAVAAEKIIDTFIEIEGAAPSDIEVAAYISKLSKSKLLEKTALVESKQVDEKDGDYRIFTLTSKIVRGLELTEDDIEQIKARPGIAMAGDGR
jgi:Tfp pilus assembly protein PilN